MTQHPQGAISCQWGSIEVVCWPVHKHFIMITFLGHQGLLAWLVEDHRAHKPPPSPPMLLMDIYRESNSCTANGPLVRSAQPLHATRILFYGTFCHSSLGVFLWFVNICYYYKVTSTFTIHSVTYIYLLISDAANKVCRLDQKKPLNNCFTQHGKNNFITTSA